MSYKVYLVIRRQDMSFEFFSQNFKNHNKIEFRDWSANIKFLIIQSYNGLQDIRSKWLSFENEKNSRNSP